MWRPEGLIQAAETASAKAPRQSLFSLLEKQQGSQYSRSRVNEGESVRGEVREVMRTVKGALWLPFGVGAIRGDQKRSRQAKQGTMLSPRREEMVAGSSREGPWCEQQSDSGCVLKVEQTGFACGSMWASGKERSQAGPKGVGVRNWKKRVAIYKVEMAKGSGGIKRRPWTCSVCHTRQTSGWQLSLRAWSSG